MIRAIFRSKRLVASAAIALCVPFSASAVVTQWAKVGGAGNACDSQVGGCFGAVADAYRIAVHEVTNAEYAEFLNAVARSDDPHGLYNPAMGTGLGGIVRQGSSQFHYSTIGGYEARPVNWVSYYDTLRYLNWLHNGRQPAPDPEDSVTEDGAYTFTSPVQVGARNLDAGTWLPTEDEWYKAAYYDSTSGSYFDYPAGSDAQTSCAAPSAAANTANCGSAVGGPTEVGSYPGAPSPSGTFDQGGNVAEWTETSPGAGVAVQRGGGFLGPAGDLAASHRGTAAATLESADVGFRIATFALPPASDIEWVTVGDPDNPESAYSLGSVLLEFEISKYEVTNAQYAEFLNAVAAVDPGSSLYYPLYYPEMGSTELHGGIRRSGSQGSYSYSPIPGREDLPAVFVTLQSALRFANWLSNGKPTGAQGDTTTEDGAYRLGGTGPVYRKGGTVFVPYLNEWYKAAFYDPLTSSYFGYATGSNTPPACAAPGSSPDTANCDGAVGDATPGGSYTGVPSPNGTFDQGGNVSEWIFPAVNEYGYAQQVMGGDWTAPASLLSTDAPSVGYPIDDARGPMIGVRLVRGLPEPGALLQLACGAAALLGLAIRKRSA